MSDNASKVFRALLRKEWREQRWRFFLATIVLSGLLAGWLRAQIVPSVEAAALIYGPVGLVLVIFLAAGPVAGERADRTWEFLVAQPVSRYAVLRAKWALGVLQLAGTMAIATAAGLLAMWSRGLRMLPRVTPYEAVAGRTHPLFSGLLEPFALPTYKLTVWLAIHPLLSLCVFAVVATIALACWFTPLCLVLTRARNEFAAALGGVLLTVALLLWLAQFGVGVAAGSAVLLLVPALLNPLASFVLLLGWGALFLPVVLLIHIGLWIVLPLRYFRRDPRGLVTKWIQA